MARQSSLFPRKTPVQRRAHATLEAIVEGAAQVFSREGLVRGTTSRIARRAGVSVGSLYQYFPSKQALLVALLERHMKEAREVLAGLLQEVSREPPPVDVAVRRLVEGLLAIHADHPRLHRILVEEAPRPKALRDALYQVEERFCDDVAALFVAHPAVQLSDPRATAWVTVQTLHLVVHRYLASPPEGVDAETLAGELVELVVRRIARGSATGSSDR